MSAMKEALRDIVETVGRTKFARRAALAPLALPREDERTETHYLVTSVADKTFKNGETMRSTHARARLTRDEIFALQKIVRAAGRHPELHKKLVQITEPVPPPIALELPDERRAV